MTKNSDGESMDRPTLVEQLLWSVLELDLLYILTCLGCCALQVLFQIFLLGLV